MNKIGIAAVGFAIVLTACTWVKTTPEGEKVRVAATDMVGHCKKLGKTAVSLKHKVGRMDRKPEKVATELQTLARNEGAAMGGDTVVAETKPTDGRQEFGIYDCQQG